MAITSFRIREELQDPLEKAATELRRPKAWIINEALAAYFERDNQNQRMYRETLEGLADVEAGRVIDGDQVVAWIESWGSDKELPPPRT
jgi:predicted transcriptional regulator